MRTIAGLVVVTMVLGGSTYAQQIAGLEPARKGIEALEKGRTDEARLLFVEALRANPSLTPASLALGELLYSAGDLDNAITIYEQAQAHAPDHPHLKKRLDAWRKEAELHSRFGQRLGDHFTVLFEGPAEADLAGRAVEVLEAAFWRVGAALNRYPAQAVTVVLYTREQFRDITQSPGWAGGAFDGRIRVPVQGAMKNPREFERVLAHEFTHAVVRSLAPRGVPFWLDEGLAVVYEGSDLATRRELVRQSASLLPLARLERSFERLDPAQVKLAYAQSGVAVQLLIDNTGTAGLVNLLDDIGRGVPFDEAFQRHALMSYAEFQRTLAARDHDEIR